MGSMNAEGFAEAAREGLVSLKRAVGINLTSNHYPPLPGGYVDPIIAAIEAVREDEPTREIDITEVVTSSGVEPRVASRVEDRIVISAVDLLEITHSWAFVAEDEADDEEETEEHPEDCLYCAAGEPMAHNYERPQED